MKIIEGYNGAVKEYGKQVADKMIQNGIPKNFLLAACRFHAGTRNRKTQNMRATATFYSSSSGCRIKHVQTAIKIKRKRIQNTPSQTSFECFIKHTTL